RRLYASYFGGRVLIFKFDGSFVGGAKLVTEVAAPPPPHGPPSFKYLVESSESSLLMVLRNSACVSIRNDSGAGVNKYYTKGFAVYRLHLDSSNDACCRWSKADNIGDDILFLGWNSSFSLPSTQFPSCDCEGNSIYFTDNLTDFHDAKNGSGSDIGVFNLNRGIVEPLPGYNPPVWITH
ncbi:hypothetical protein ACH5RR_013559, partial [Cinchona calisaya]